MADIFSVTKRGSADLRALRVSLRPFVPSRHKQATLVASRAAPFIRSTRWLRGARAMPPRAASSGRNRIQPRGLTSPRVAPNLGESSYSGPLNGRTRVLQMTGTKSGRERRKAWIYSVINPLLEGLRIEATFLARENWTFRRYNRELEFIRPARILVGHVSLPNLEDLEKSKPDTQKVIERREAQREKLRDACRAAFDTLAAEP